MLLALTGASAVWLSNRQDTAVGWVRHTLEVQNRLSNLMLLLVSAEAGQRGYLVSGEKTYLSTYDEAVARLPDAIEALRATTIDNRWQQVDIGRLREEVRGRLEMLSVGVALADMNKREDALAVMHSGRDRALVNNIRAIITRMGHRETALLEQRSTHAATITALARAVVIASALLIVLFALILVPDGLRRIKELERTNLLLESEIAERSAAQVQVRQLQKMEAVGQLTGGIAHDFNNMLAIVIGSLDMARRRLTGAEHPRLAPAIDNAIDGAQRAATLTARLLAFSRRQPLEPRVVDSNRLVGGMSELLRRTIGGTVRIETVLAGGLWPVCADAAQIENAILNLAVNARDAMLDGGRLTIETANAELDDRYARAHDEVTAGQYVVIAVTDTGHGMPQSVIDRAFEPFFTTKDVGKGTGLGLSQVFGFIKQSSGHLKIYSEVGAGTTIKMYLPRHIGPDLTAMLEEQAGGAVPQGRIEEIILVVEDEDQVRHMSVDALRDLGYTVIHAAGAEEALAKLEVHEQVDLLFTDVIMPGLTGRQLADKVRETRPGIPVLYTTGYTRNAIVHSGVVDHDVNFLSKPFTIDTLARKVREVLDRK